MDCKKDLPGGSIPRLDTFHKFSPESEENHNEVLQHQRRKAAV